MKNANQDNDLQGDCGFVATYGLILCLTATVPKKQTIAMFSARTAICPSCSQTVDLTHQSMQVQWRLACFFCKTRFEVTPNRASKFLAALSLLPLFTIVLSRFASTRMHVF